MTTALIEYTPAITPRTVRDFMKHLDEHSRSVYGEWADEVMKRYIMPFSKYRGHHLSAYFGSVSARFQPMRIRFLLWMSQELGTGVVAEANQDLLEGMRTLEFHDLEARGFSSDRIGKTLLRYRNFLTYLGKLDPKQTISPPEVHNVVDHIEKMARYASRFDLAMTIFVAASTDEIQIDRRKAQFLSRTIVRDWERCEAHLMLLFDVKVFPDQREPSSLLAERDELAQEDDFFKANLDKLLAEHEGSYVAILGRQVVAVDKDLKSLARRVYSVHGYRPILMRLVSRSPEVFGFHSPATA